MEFIVHLPNFRVVVCQECQVAILPNQIETHFTTNRPHGFTKETRQRIREAVRRIDGLIQDEEELGKCEFPFPPDTSKPVVALAAPKNDGLRCTLKIGGLECPFIGTYNRNMRRHLFEKHNWKSTNKGGHRKQNSPQQAPEVPWRSGVQYQRFFKKGHKSGFFEVARGQGSSVSMSEPRSTWDKVKEGMKKGFEKVEEVSRKKIEATDESREPNPWLRRLGGPRHLGGRDAEKIQALVRPIDDKDDPILEVIHRSFIRMIRAAQKAAKTEVVGHFALVEANRKESSQKARKPFNSRMVKTTFQSYTRWWTQILYYIHRAKGIPEDQKPRFKMTRKQQRVFDRLQAAAGEVVSQGEGDQPEAKQARKEVESQVLRFCIALLDHELGDNQYQSGIISGLVVLAIQPGGRWANPEDYTPILSGIIKLARLMVIFQAYQTRQASIAQKVHEGVSQEEAEETSRSHVELVQQMCRKFMMLMSNPGTPSPMDWILELRTYGLHIRYHTAAEGCISWKGDTILYQQIQFSMQQVRSMVQGLVAETRRVLIEDLLMFRMDEHGDVQGQPLPRIDWANIVDNPTEQKVGWSFLEDIRNQFKVKMPGREWLAKRVVDEPELKQEFIQEEQGEEIQWRHDAVSAYEQKVKKFQEKLLILMHLTGGQAARATEIMSIRHRNTANGGVRNIFIDEGMVLFVTAYHKGYEYSEKAKIIQRFLPREVGELVVYYLWLALPFWEAMQVIVDGAEELSAFMWGDETNPGQQSPDWDEEAEVAEEANAVEADAVEEAEQADAVEEAEPAGPAKRKSCSQAWTSERMRKIMQRESMAWMGVRINISAWRQAVIAIARKFLRDGFGVDLDESSSGGFDDFDEDNAEGDSPWDLQGGHGTRIAGMIYARLMSEGQFESKSQKEQFRQVSQDWHQFLWFASSQAGFGVGIGKKRRRMHWEAVNQEMQQLRHAQLRQASTRIHAQLQVLLGAGAQFRGQQEPAIRSIMEGHSPVMVVMGTGGGKSMLFMLPASSVSGGITIVVVPLVALQGDLQQRCEQAQISSVVWDSQQPHTMASIIFVTPESAVSKTFANCINRWQEMCQIERIVIDESHCMLEGSPSFRPKLRQLGELVFTKAQMVYLTATLPPRDEAEFFQLMHIQGPELKMFRGRTTRANVAYRVQEVEVEEESPPGQATDKRGFPTVIQDAVLQLVQEKLQQYPAPAKIIIYSSSIAGAKQLGELLECEVYYRDVDSRDGKARRLEDWRRARDDGRLGQGRVIVATNALGLGVDVPDIRAVCHVGKIWELRGYAQGSGRAGRDGEKSEAIIIRAIGVGGDLYPRGPQIDIAEFIEGVVCRRIILDAVMDAPRAREGCEDGEEKCDVCRGGEEAFLGSPDRFPDSGIGSSPANQADPRPAQIARSSPPGGVSRRGAQGGFSSSPFRFHPSSPCPVKAPDHSRIEQMRQRDWTHFRVSQQRRREGQEVQELVDWLDEWHRECPLCHLRGFQGDRRHRLDECWREEAHPVHLQSESMTKQMQELKAFERFSCCMWCGIPQAICDRWQPIEDQGGWAEVVGGSRQYAGLLMPAIITMMMEGCEEGLQVLDKWFAKAQVHKEHSQDVCRWFGKQIIWGGIQATQMVQVFHMLAKANRF